MCSLHALFINSTDRRSVFVNFTIHVPERLLQLNSETRLVQATNNCIKLRMCLTFPEPVLNSSAEILNSIKVQILYALQLSQGTLLRLAISKQHPGHRRFEYKVRRFSQSSIIFSAVRIEVS